MPSNIFPMLLDISPIIRFIPLSTSRILTTPGRHPMTRDGSHRSTPPPSEAWHALRAQVAARFRALNDEIRHYPRPIARCDEQLTRLIEQRDRVRALQERMAAAETSEPDAARLRDILEEALGEDEIAAAMAPGLKALIGGSG